MVAQSIVPLNQDNAVSVVAALKMLVRRLRDEQMVDGQDYGKIPGTNDKPTLLLPGMEKLMRALNVVPQYTERRVIVDYDKPLFHYEYECRLIDVETGLAVPGGLAVGLAHSYESKWRWRWAIESRVPANLDKATLETRNGSLKEPEFAIKKKEMAGKFGKPAEYWQQFEKAIEDGTAKATTMPKKDGGTMTAWEIGGTEYRIPNPDIFDQINTICKIAQKRALSSAIKGAAAVSEFFTVDLDDRDENTITVTPEIVDEKPAQTEPPKPTNITPINNFASKSPRLPVQTPPPTPQINVVDGNTARQITPEVREPEQTETPLVVSEVEPSLNGTHEPEPNGDIPKNPVPSENSKVTEEDISQWEHYQTLMAHAEVKKLYTNSVNRKNMIALLKQEGAFKSGKVSSMVWRIQTYHKLRAEGWDTDKAASAAATAPDELEGF